MSTVDDFVQDMKRIAETTTPADRAAFEAWVRSLPESPEHPEQETTAVFVPGKKQGEDLKSVGSRDSHPSG